MRAGSAMRAGRVRSENATGILAAQCRVQNRNGNKNRTFRSKSESRRFSDRKEIFQFSNPSLVTKPKAKRVCFDLDSAIALVENEAENNFLASKISAQNALWLRINDSKNESEWVVDRWGYEKPKSFVQAAFFNWESDTTNDERKNSARIKPDAKWEMVKFQSFYNS